MNLRRISVLAMSVCGVMLLCACVASAAEEGSGAAGARRNFSSGLILRLWRAW